MVRERVGGYEADLPLGASSEPYTRQIQGGQGQGQGQGQRLPYQANGQEEFQLGAGADEYEFGANVIQAGGDTGMQQAQQQQQQDSGAYGAMPLPGGVDVLGPPPGLEGMVGGPVHPPAGQGFSQSLSHADSSLDSTSLTTSSLNFNAASFEPGVGYR